MNLNNRILNFIVKGLKQTNTLKKHRDNRKMVMQDRRMDMATNISVLSTVLYRSLADDQSHRTYCSVGARTVFLFYFTVALFSYNKCQDYTSDSTFSSCLRLLTRPLISRGPLSHPVSLLYILAVITQTVFSESSCFFPKM